MKRNLVGKILGKIKIFVQDFVPKGGSYGNKILYKNLNFFDKIFVPSKISLRSLWEKNLVDGEMFSLGMVSTNLYMLFYAGRYKIQIAEGWEWQRIFS